MLISLFMFFALLAFAIVGCGWCISVVTGLVMPAAFLLAVVIFVLSFIFLMAFFFLDAVQEEE